MGEVIRFSTGKTTNRPDDRQLRLARAAELVVTASSLVGSKTVRHLVVAIEKREAQRK